MQLSDNQVYTEVGEALKECGRATKVGVCCVNMDGATPDRNVRAMFQAALDYDASVCRRA